jgi:microcin C transport system permease protein
VDDPDHLSHLYPARHHEGGARRSRFDLWISAVIWPAVRCRAFWLPSDHGDRRRQLFLDIPLRGLVSDNWAALSWLLRLADYFWPITLPTAALVNSGFAR